MHTCSSSPHSVTIQHNFPIQKLINTYTELVVSKVEDVRNQTQAAGALKTAVASHMYGYENLLAPLIAKACIQVCPSNITNFNVDNVRVSKIVGGGVSDVEVVQGFVLARGAEGTVKHIKNAKIGVFGSGIDLGKTESKGILKVENADQLLNFAKGEEKQMEDIIKSIADAGVNVVVSGSTISDMALHFLERYKIMAVKTPSKFQLRRICKAVHATPIVKIGAPTQEELGHCDVVTVEEIGSTQVTIFRQEKEGTAVATLVVRGSTDNIMDDVERSIDDGVNVYKSMCKDNRFVPGAGATEIEVARRLQIFADSTPGLEQYAIRKYAEAFEVVARTLAETSGFNATEIISNLYAAHTKGTHTAGLNIETGEVVDVVPLGILDLLSTKLSAVKLATATAVTVLRVDQIIVSKPAGGPKPPKQGPMDADD